MSMMHRSPLDDHGVTDRALHGGVDPSPRASEMLVDYETYEPLVVRPNAKGRIPWTQNLRSAISRWFFEDRLQPLTQAELDAADAHQHHTLAHDDEIVADEIAGAHERAGVREDEIAAPDVHVTETGNTPSSVIATEPVKKPRKKKSEDGE